MPLPRYGVVVGSLKSFTRDPRHDFGSWYHGHIALTTGDGVWKSALDVAAPESVGVAYRLVEGLQAADLGPVRDLASGFHALRSNSGSGALDYARSPVLRDGPVLATARRVIGSQSLPDPFDILLSTLESVAQAVPRAVRDRVPGPRPPAPWVDSNGDNALDALEPHVRDAGRIYVFGDRFERGRGVHDVHMNQGDPFGSQWWDSNGIWQDGAVACEGGSGVVIWQVRFKTQRMNTDDEGHPA